MSSCQCSLEVIILEAWVDCQARAREAPLRVSSISPGIVETEFYQTSRFGDEAGAQKFYNSMKSLQPEDIAQVLATFRSPVLTVQPQQEDGSPRTCLLHLCNSRVSLTPMRHWRMCSNANCEVWSRQCITCILGGVVEVGLSCADGGVGAERG